ncbi:unnamed protein product [Brassicogethes aeneus]|uniref:Uncharacterized protein n=1 Tax=Brassicogethes aeneus TaxID=1431903 RepID=A0A9P0AUA6_BRAAE|nr:unnamed protein product [Brassicogethes aeneus]
MTKVCRLCLIKLQRGSKYFNINAVESFSGFMPYRDQLTTCIPEMALDLIPNPVICNVCRQALRLAYDFKNRCLKVEEKIRKHVESQPSGSEYDLSELGNYDHGRSLVLINYPSVNNLNTQIQKPEYIDIKHHYVKQIMVCKQEPESGTTVKLGLKEESDLYDPEILPVENNELEIEAIYKCPIRKCGLEFEDLEQLQNHKEYHLPSFAKGGKKGKKFACTIKNCPESFESVALLSCHKIECHANVMDVYLCNFCNMHFRSLQLLRRHNSQCQKDSKPDAITTILTKRPHLPTKAKNHLKKWLFKHTDHPYPTDQEKQQLMIETNLTLLQVENWFINARRRILQDLTRLKARRLSSASLMRGLEEFDVSMRFGRVRRLHRHKK